MKATRPAAYCATFLATMACAPTETGNPGGDHGTAILRLTAHTSDPSIAALGASAGGIGVEELRASLDEVRLVPCAPEAPDVVLDGPGPVDLVAADADLEVPAGAYCELTLRLASTLPDAGAAAASLSLAGERSDGANLTITSSRPVDVVLVPTAGELNLVDEALAFLSLDVSVWLSNVDVASLVPDALGNVIVSVDSNANVLTHFEEQIPTATTMHLDSDGDGQLGSDELHEPIAAP